MTPRGDSQDDGPGREGFQLARVARRLERRLGSARRRDEKPSVSCPAESQETFLRGAFSAAKAYASSEAFAEESARRIKARSKPEDAAKLPIPAADVTRERARIFIETCSAVDFDAKLQVQGGAAHFVEAAQEAKPPLWKACYRAGPRLTKVALDLAKGWLAESPQAPAAVPVPVPAVNAALLSPGTATARAPDAFKVKLATTKGDIIIEIHRAWAPYGADRFYNLVKIGFFNGVEFFRVIDGFMAQVGIHGDPAVAAKWHDANIPDDAASGHSNQRGVVTFAMGGPNTRTTQFFINFKDNSFLDSRGFPPIGKVVEGDAVLDKLYRGYGEGAPGGNGPDQGRMQAEGNAYLKAQFPNLDSIKTARIVPL